MRFMMLMIPRRIDRAEDWQPSADDVSAMMQYNEELARAGVLLALDGLRHVSEAARVARRGGQTTVTDGPFAEANEVVGGYWVIQTGSKEEAVEWARRCPLGEGDTIEVRQIFEMEDFPEDVQTAAGELSQEPPEQPLER